MLEPILLAYFLKKGPPGERVPETSCRKVTSS
jgi:hypothetical protein